MVPLREFKVRTVKDYFLPLRGGAGDGRVEMRTFISLDFLEHFKLSSMGRYMALVIK